MTDDYTRLTGLAPTSMREFVQENAAAYARSSNMA
jgi:hypothetical protein